jgi:hypothetical protein
MASLRSFTEGFNSYAEFYSRTAASSNTSAVSVTSTSTAAPAPTGWWWGKTSPADRFRQRGPHDGCDGRSGSDDHDNHRFWRPLGRDHHRGSTISDVRDAINNEAGLSDLVEASIINDKDRDVPFTSAWSSPLRTADRPTPFPSAIHRAQSGPDHG